MGRAFKVALFASHQQTLPCDWLNNPRKVLKSKTTILIGTGRNSQYATPSFRSVSFSMEKLDARFIFSNPILLKQGDRSQVLVCDYRPPRRTNESSKQCVLKFFPERFHLNFEKEVATYHFLLKAEHKSRLVNPLGYDKWPRGKYIKTIGRNIKPFAAEGADQCVDVLMLEYVPAGTQESQSTKIPLTRAASAMTALKDLHNLGVVHGDVSIDNILAPDEETVMWIDFSNSWLDASKQQLNWEWVWAAEYFSNLVYSATKRVLRRRRE